MHGTPRQAASRRDEELVEGISDMLNEEMLFEQVLAQVLPRALSRFLSLPSFPRARAACLCLVAFLPRRPRVGCLPACRAPLASAERAGSAPVQRPRKMLRESLPALGAATCVLRRGAARHQVSASYQSDIQEVLSKAHAHGLPEGEEGGMVQARRD